MVWPFSSSSSSSTTTTTSSSSSSGPKSSDGGFVAPDRSARERCYESRDRLFECLDQNDILDAVKEDEKSRRVCPKENEAYERDCAKAWTPELRERGDIVDFLVVIVLTRHRLPQIKYFKEKRVMEYNRDQTIAKIQADDAATVARQKADKKKGSGLFK